MKQSIIHLFSLIFAMSGSNHTSAQDWVQMGPDIHGEAAGDNSGRHAISADGTIVAVGAPGNDGNGENSGHVRVFQLSDGRWSQMGDDIDGEAAKDNSGGWLSLSSNGMTVAIGALMNDGNGSDSGHVRVYRYEQENWVQLGADLDGEAEGDLSGVSLSLSGNGTIVAIGASNNDNDGGDMAGQVRVFRLSEGNWEQVGSDIDGDVRFRLLGSYVSLSQNGSIVATTMKSLGNSGSVRVFHYVDGDWSQLGSDLDEVVESGNAGAASLSLSADGLTIAIGDPSNDGNGTDSGRGRVYRFADGRWTQLGSDIFGEAAGDRAGYQVSLSADGTIMGIGAPYNTDRAGNVRIFQYVDGDWTQLGSDIDGRNAGDFSNYVALSGNGRIVATGAWWSDGNGENSGSVRVFELIKLIPLKMAGNRLEFATESGADYTVLTTTNLTTGFTSATNLIGNGQTNSVPINFNDDQRFFRCSETIDE